MRYAVKLFILIFIMVSLSSCALFGIERKPIQQGNLIKPAKVAQLRRGMSKIEVANLMGSPVLDNTFRPNRWEYVYYLKPYHKKPILKHVLISFRYGKVVDIATAG